MVGETDDEIDDDDDDDTQVIFSLRVESRHPIAALESMRELTHPNGKLRPDDDVLYPVGDTASFIENDWSVRADKLDAAVTAALDRLEESGVDTDDLQHPDVFVCAFFTFGYGAETISADAVERLARVHATIWIDANS